jgi:hypothetical protein
MKDDAITIGMFEGFSFRNQCAIDQNLTADEVLNWDHDEQGEAEFWSDGSEPLVSKLLSGNSCSAEEIRQVMRILEELDGKPAQIAKAVYLKDGGSSLKDIDREAVDDSSLYVFGPGWFTDLEKEAAYELFEMFWPEPYEFWRRNTVPGLTFDVEAFMQSFSTMELKIADGGYLIVEVE